MPDSLNSLIYDIVVEDSFKKDLKTYFKNIKKKQIRDIQVTISKMDGLNWKHIEKSFIIKKSINSYCFIGKLYCPIVALKKSKLNGARILVVIDNFYTRLHLINIVPKSEIATGNKNDFPEAYFNKIYNDYYYPEPDDDFYF